MKKILFILLLFIVLIISDVARSQWIEQSSGVDTSPLREIEFLNINTGWVVGSGGILLKTTNSGENWVSVPHPAGGKSLYSIELIDSNIIYVVGWFETIIKSTDGGNSWIEIRNGPSGQGSSYNACYFINENTGWICGSGQKVLSTTNGGATIDSSYLFIANMFDIYFKNENEGVLSGQGNILYKSTNGGTNWFHSTISLPTNQPGFRSMSFVNDSTGWTPAGDGRIFKTMDFGTSWDSIADLNTSPDALWCIDFVNENTGWTGGENGLLYKTTDGGINWRQEQIPPRTFLSVDFYNDSIGWVVGTLGKIYHTTTGGDPIVGITNNSNILDNFALNQNYPNPFNPFTTIEYQLKQKGKVELKVFDISGKEIRTLVNKTLNVGTYSINFDGGILSSGIYFYTLKINEKIIDTKKMVLLK